MSKGNTGKENTGSWNTGSWNTGDWNTGDCNTGSRNTGDCNTGSRNTGFWNTGSWNTGSWNTGSRNTGDWNTGSWNTGDCNTGDWNTGSRNTGSWNTGDWNTDEPLMRMFNKETSFRRSENKHNLSFNFYPEITKWISEDSMTDEEKKNNPKFFVTKGYLKTIPYKEAFAIAWNGLTKEQKEEVQRLPNFDAVVFFDITGIDVSVDLNSKKETMIKEAKEMIEKAQDMLRQAQGIMV